MLSAPAGGIAPAKGALVNVYATAKSDVGRVRERNEDAYVVVPELGLFGVADGMGGHKGGAHASRLTCEVLAEYVGAHREELADSPPPADDDPSPPVARLLADAVRAACAAVFDAAAADPQLAGMGTTCTVLLVRPGWAYVAHVGDSRCYIQRGSRFMQVTEDHSLVNEQVRAGLLRPEEAQHSRLKNIITRSVGFEREVEVDTFLVPLEHGDQFLMCSDGLSNLVENHELGEAMMAMQGQALADFLVNVALERGGDDNVTVVALRVDDPSLPHAPTTDTDLVLTTPASELQTSPSLSAAGGTDLELLGGPLDPAEATPLPASGLTGPLGARRVSAPASAGAMEATGGMETPPLRHHEPEATAGEAEAEGLLERPPLRHGGAKGDAGSTTGAELALGADAAATAAAAAAADADALERTDDNLNLADLLPGGEAAGPTAGDAHEGDARELRGAVAAAADGDEKDGPGATSDAEQTPFGQARQPGAAPASGGAARVGGDASDGAGETGEGGREAPAEGPEGADKATTGPATDAHGSKAGAERGRRHGRGGNKRPASVAERASDADAQDEASAPADDFAVDEPTDPARAVPAPQDTPPRKGRRR